MIRVSSNVDEAVARLGALPGVAATAHRTAMQEIAEEIVSAEVAAWPIDTGESRDGWHVEATPDGAAAANSVEYAPYVHHGLAGRVLAETLPAVQAAPIDRATQAVASKA